MNSARPGEEKPEQPRESVFGRVDQEAVISRLDTAAEEDAETSFFDAALVERQSEADRIFRDGVQVMGGLAPARDPEGPPGVRSTGGQWQPVAYSGSIVDDPAARRSFIVHGPAGVTRMQ